MAEVGHNLTGLKKDISEALGKLKQLRNERSDVNADMASIRADLESKGIPKKALAAAITYMNMDPEDREGFDLAYALVREAGGLPLQEDLFQAAERMATEQAEKKPAEPDAAGIDKVISSQEAEKVKGKKVHAPTGEHQGAIN